MQYTPGSIAFSAKNLFLTGPNAQGTVIPHGTVIINNGNAYNSATYTFTAPVKGLYYMAWSGRSYPGQRSCQDLHVNGASQGYSYLVGNMDSQYESYGSLSTLLQLNAGDTVDVRLPYNYCQAVLSQATTFKGFLVSYTP